MAFNYPIKNPCAEIFLPTKPMSEFHVIDKNAVVDGEKWYTVVTYPQAAAWIRQQDKPLWHEVSGAAFSSSVFDIHNVLLLIMKLKWPV